MIGTYVNLANTADKNPNALALGVRQNLLTGNIEELRTYIAPDGSKREVHMVWRLYFYLELARMLNRAGLTPIQVFGNFDGSEFTWDSNRMIILAEKRCEA